jgi:hypothetical protein
VDLDSLDVVQSPLESPSTEILGHDHQQLIPALLQAEEGRVVVADPLAIGLVPAQKGALAPEQRRSIQEDRCRDTSRY